MRKGIALALAGAALLPSVAHAAGCGDLRTARIAHVTVLDASERVPGAPMPSARSGAPSGPSDLPGYCRVRAVAMPVKGSRIGST